MYALARSIAARILPVWLGLFCCLASALAAGPYEDRSTSDYQYIKGTLHSLSIEERTVTIQPRKGAKVTVRVGPDTEFQWVNRLEDLQPRQEVKVWYRVDPHGNVGLKIQKLPDLGC